MANLVLIADEQAELINGGYRRCRRPYNRGGNLEISFPNVTSLTLNGIIILNNFGHADYNAAA